MVQYFLRLMCLTLNLGLPNMAVPTVETYAHLFAWQLVFAEGSLDKIPSKLKFNLLESLLSFHHNGRTRRN